MSTLRIPENVLGAFKREFWASAQIGEPEVRSIESGMQAALAEWGATVEWARPAKAPACPSRIVLPWTPVDGGQ
jgi:hypothetical protein